MSAGGVLWAEEYELRPSPPAAWRTQSVTSLEAERLSGRWVARRWLWTTLGGRWGCRPAGRDECHLRCPGTGSPNLRHRKSRVAQSLDKLVELLRRKIGGTLGRIARRFRRLWGFLHVSLQKSSAPSLLRLLWIKFKTVARLAAALSSTGAEILPLPVITMHDTDICSA
jgi:hypothetical protein